MPTYLKSCTATEQGISREVNTRSFFSWVIEQESQERLTPAPVPVENKSFNLQEQPVVPEDAQRNFRDVQDTQHTASAPKAEDDDKNDQESSKIEFPRPSDQLEEEVILLWETIIGVLEVTETSLMNKNAKETTEAKTRVSY